jgi:pyruvate/2-oxoglutarate/acetoin dehydrogenase E1 component
MVRKSQEAARIVHDQTGQSVEILDLRTLNPIDLEAIEASVKKTTRALVIHEDLLTGGFGAEVAALVSENMFESLDAPVQRVAAYDCPAIPYETGLEGEILPQVAWIENSLTKLLEY